MHLQHWKTCQDENNNLGPGKVQMNCSIVTEKFDAAEAVRLMLSDILH